MDNTHKDILILIFVILSSAATVTDSWLTTYWYGLYPFLYYCIGMRLREKNVHFKKIPTFLMLIGVLCLQSIYTYFAGYGEVFDWILNFGGYSNAYNCIPTAIASVLCFLLWYDIKISNNLITRILSTISGKSLEIYLLGCLIADAPIKTAIFNRYLANIGHVGCFFILVLIEIPVATVVGMLINGFMNFLQNWIYSLTGKEQKIQ